MTPSTLVRARRGPFTFVGMTAFVQALMEERAGAHGVTRPTRRRRTHVCVATQDDGRVCGLPAHCIDMRRGGFVCDEHRPGRNAECKMQNAK